MSRERLVALAGAGVFVTTVVAGGIALVKPFMAASRPFLRDVIFYMAAVFFTFVVLYLGRIRLGEALGERCGSWGWWEQPGGAVTPHHSPFPGYLGLYVFYVLTVVLCTWIHRRQRGDGLAPPRPWEPGKGCPAGMGPLARWDPLPLPLSTPLPPQRCRQTWKSRSPQAQTVGTMVRCSLLRPQGSQRPPDCCRCD